MARAIRTIIVVLAAVLVAGWWLTRPQQIAASAIPEHTPDPLAGEQVFLAGGCASCHASPVDGKRAKGDAKKILGGGLELETDFGVFRVPNISPHREDGIGDWSTHAFVNAMQRGVSPDGKHFYPSFPYTSYARMPVEDVIDLKAYLDTLPAVAGRIEDSELAFPWSIRRGIGLWKRRYLDVEPVVQIDASNTQAILGRELVEGAGHCGECHSPRDRFGGIIKEQWLAGAPDLEGRGQVPNITPAGENIAGWSMSDLVYYLETGFTPDFDTVGGSMVAVQESLALLPRSDLEAIATYMKAVPGVE
ncbi:MAG: cytochrome c [Gammaproteobacteria bacterium]|nr:cytochrome c [Gammaproteobacteria bacterium]